MIFFLNFRYPYLDGLHLLSPDDGFRVAFEEARVDGVSRELGLQN